MNSLMAAIGVGAVGVAVAIVGVFSILTRHNGVSRRADEVQRTDPALAEELRNVQAGIDRGTRRVFY